MIILKATTEKIQVVLAGAITTNQLQCVASYRDITTSAFTAGGNDVDTNNTTDVDLVAAPASSTQRVIDFISIYNRDTASAVVTIKKDNNGTEFVLFSCTLGSGERIEYQEGKGFSVFTNAGSVKQSINQGTSPANSNLNIVVLNSDVTNNNAVANTIQDVTGLSFPVVAGNKYYFRATIQYTSAATNTGSRWSINGPTTSGLIYISRYSLTTTSFTFNTLTAYNAPASSNATSAATAGNIAILEGFITPISDGTVVVTFASEVANSAIIAKAGSLIEYIQVI